MTRGGRVAEVYEVSLLSVRVLGGIWVTGLHRRHGVETVGIDSQVRSMKYATTNLAQIPEKTRFSGAQARSLAFLNCSNLKCSRHACRHRTVGRLCLDERRKDVKTPARCALCLITSVLAISIRAHAYPR